jgi:hypothetical protein
MAKLPLLYSLSCRGEELEAFYNPTDIPLFNGNKYITAIPQRDRSQIFSGINFHPSFDPAIREATTETRILNLKIIFAQYFQGLNLHLDYAGNIFDAIRLSLVKRNPEDSRHIRHISQVLSELEPLWEAESQSEIVQPRVSLLPYDYHIDSDQILTANGELTGYYGFHFVGHAGMGKTVATCRLLKLLPQLIRHPQLNGRFATAKQLVWFVQSVPHDGSLKTLCRNFLAGVSSITRTRYDQLYRVDSDRTTTTMLMLAMATVCAVLHVGVFVLDEIQYLLHSKGQNEILVLNFLNDLTSALGIPVVMMGTYPALELLGGEFRQLRRGLEQPQQDWHPLPFTTLENETPLDDSWRVFMKSMWQYQVVRKPVEFDEYWNTFFHQHSMGVIDIARKLFIFSQIRAMWSFQETLTPDIVYSVYSDYFSKIGRYAEIYQRRKFHLLTEFSDYPNITIEEFIERDMQIEDYPKLSFPLLPQPVATNDEKGEATQAAITETGKANGNKNKQTKKSKTAPKPAKSLVSIPKDDLRSIVREGKTKGLSPAQALEEAGDVVDPVKSLQEWSKK